MRRLFLIGIALLAVLAIGGATVTAGKINKGVPASSLHGDKNVKNHSIGHLSYKRNSVSCENLSLDLVQRVCKGLPSNPGTPGKDGTNGVNGKDGTNGTNGVNGVDGAKGDKGDQGAVGPQGPAGPSGLGAPGVVVTHVVGPDSSVCGGDWATDTYKRTLQFIPQDNGTIQVIRSYKGTFETIAGVPQPNAAPGPNQCDPVQVGGITGTFTGFDVVIVTGGNFAPDATCAANCTSAAMLAAFFPGGSSAVNNGWEYHYDAGVNGQWTNADASRGGNVGNITG